MPGVQGRSGELYIPLPNRVHVLGRKRSPFNRQAGRALKTNFARRRLLGFLETSVRVVLITDHFLPAPFSDRPRQGEGGVRRRGSSRCSPAPGLGLFVRTRRSTLMRNRQPIPLSSLSARLCGDGERAHTTVTWAFAYFTQ